MSTHHLARQALAKYLRDMLAIVESDAPDREVAQQWGDFLSSHYKAVEIVLEKQRSTEPDRVELRVLDRDNSPGD